MILWGHKRQGNLRFQEGEVINVNLPMNVECGQRLVVCRTQVWLRNRQSICGDDPRKSLASTWISCHWRSCRSQLSSYRTVLCEIVRTMTLVLPIDINRLAVVLTFYPYCTLGSSCLASCNPDFELHVAVCLRSVRRCPWSRFLRVLRFPVFSWVGYSSVYFGQHLCFTGDLIRK